MTTHSGATDPRALQDAIELLGRVKEQVGDAFETSGPAIGPWPGRIVQS